jgi:hypothetical protein
MAMNEGIGRRRRQGKSKPTIEATVRRRGCNFSRRRRRMDRAAGEAVDLAAARISPHILEALMLIATAENDPGNQKLPG